MKTKFDWSELEIKFIAACVISGLTYMHANNVIHRDIKPENLLVGEDGYVRITDMGISRMWSKDNS